MRTLAPLLGILVAAADAAARWAVVMGSDFWFQIGPLGLGPAFSRRPLLWPFPRETALFAVAGAVCCAVLLFYQAGLPSPASQAGRCLLLGGLLFNYAG